MVACPQCGRPVPEGAEFCPMDGARIEASGHVDPLAGRVVGRHVRLDERIADGGMSFVYRATHTLVGRALAVKLLRPELRENPGVVERFLREAEYLASLSHPNVVEFVDYGVVEGGVGEAEGAAFTVMEFLEGETLAERIDRQRLPPTEALQIGLQVCCGLEAIHELGIVHRDLKPENIILARDGRGDRVPKIIDFGIARSGAHRVTANGEILGTPEYMSPEQALGKQVDRRTDIFSLGMLLFEMLTGQLPTQAPARLTLAAPGLTHLRAVEGVVAHMLVKDRRERLQSSSDARRALQNALATDLGSDAEARVRATLVAGSGSIGLELSQEPAPSIRQAPMGWRDKPSPPLPRTRPPLRPQPLEIDSRPVPVDTAPLPEPPSPKTRRPARSRFPLIVGATAICSAAASLGTYAVVTRTLAVEPKPMRAIEEPEVQPGYTASVPPAASPAVATHETAEQALGPDGLVERTNDHPEESPSTPAASARAQPTVVPAALPSPDQKAPKRTAKSKRASKSGDLRDPF